VVLVTDAADIERALRRLSRGARLAQLHRRLNREAGVDLDRPAYIALASLAESGPLALSALAEASGVDVSTMSRLVDRLMAAGLSEARRSPTDQRVTVLSLSPAGAEVVERLKAVRRAALARVLDDWTPEERATFARLLGRFVDGLERAAEPAPAQSHAGRAAKRPVAALAGARPDGAEGGAG
jgi:DNA-binding MarR family transcriptional regulator